MSNDLANKFVERNHLRVIAGEQDSMDLFYPYLLMDAAYQIYATDIKPFKCRTEMKRCKGRLADAYNSYWKRLFTIFSTDEVDSIVEMMDGYADFIATQVMQLKVAAMNVIVKAIPSFDSQKILASCFVSTTLSDCANAVHECIFRNRIGEQKQDPDISAVNRLTQEFADYYIERYTD